jgi:FAD/FMN-containing dehydrogenase
LAEPTPTIGTARVIARGDDAYEEVRQSATWNAKKPDRFPELIVIVHSTEDVVEAVRFARAAGLKVAVRAGGHSMCGSAIRDGGMMIDLSQLRSVVIDADARTASIEPAVTSRELAAALGEQGLAFPVGHCGSVALSGYLLSGGLGWNMGAWGPACFSLLRVELVTADGEIVSADEQENAELFWAARGSGPGFFGVVTRFHVAVQLAPKVMSSSMYLYPLADVEEVSRWAADLVSDLPPHVEMLLRLASAPPGVQAGPAGKAVAVTAVAFSETEEEATRSLALLETCPARGRALFRQVDQPASFEGLHDMMDQVLPEGHRYLEDTLWSNETLPGVLPRLAEGFVGAPSPMSMVMAAPIPLRPAGFQMPDAAYSIGGRTFLLCYSIWQDASEDERNERWLRGLAASIGPQTIGHYIAENDFLADPARAAQSFAPANWEKLQTFRAKHDPGGLFHSYLEPGAS